MPRIGRKVIIAGVGALVLIAGASAATAAVMSSGPVDSSGVIHGCYSNEAFNGSHVFVLQDAGTSCPRGTTAISWNEQGPAGPSDIDGGTVVMDNSVDTCTVLSSFGPDKVTVTFDVRTDINPGLAVCALSGLPSNADVQATSVFERPYPGDIGTVATVYPNPDGSTDVSFSLAGGIVPDGVFNWLAVPSS